MKVAARRDVACPRPCRANWAAARAQFKSKLNVTVQWEPDADEDPDGERRKARVEEASERARRAGVSFAVTTGPACAD
jgi:hypothetical protein